MSDCLIRVFFVVVEKCILHNRSIYVIFGEGIDYDELIFGLTKEEFDARNP